MKHLSNVTVRRLPWLLFGLLIVMSFADAGEGRADPLARPSIDDAKWRFDFTPYVFLPTTVRGDSTIAGQTVSLDLDLSDLLDILDFSFASGKYFLVKHLD